MDGSDIVMTDDPSMLELDRPAENATSDCDGQSMSKASKAEDPADESADDGGDLQSFHIDLPSESEDEAHESPMADSCNTIRILEVHDSEAQPITKDPKGKGHTDDSINIAGEGHSFHIDLPSDSEDEEVAHLPQGGTSHHIGQSVVSNRYLREHIESLRWMYDQLRTRNHLIVRLRDLMQRDLDEINRAIRAKEEEEM